MASSMGETLYGLFLCSFSPVIAEITGYAVVDMEHGTSSALPCLQALAATATSTATPAILRLPECSETWAKKALDLGPQGIIRYPGAGSEGCLLLSYPPNGVRGAAHPIIRASRYGIDEEYLGKCEKELLIMCQVESMEGIRNVREIAAVDGVDCIQIGPLDLSASMGQLWDPVNEKVKAMMSEAEEAVMLVVVMGLIWLGLLCRMMGLMSLGLVDMIWSLSAAVEDVNKFKMRLKLTSEVGGSN